MLQVNTFQFLFCKSAVVERAIENSCAHFLSLCFRSRRRTHSPLKVLQINNSFAETQLFVGDASFGGRFLTTSFRCCAPRTCQFALAVLRQSDAENRCNYCS